MVTEDNAADRHAGAAQPVRAAVKHALVGLTVAAVGLLASGCVHVQVSMSVSNTDLVSGQVVAAAAPNPASPHGPMLTVPKEMADQAHARPYDSGGYVGAELDFTNLNFTQLAKLASTGTDQNGHFQLSLRRTGDLVDLTGSADLTQITTQGALVRLAVTFPGTVLNTDGHNDAGTVTWNLTAGQVNTFAATAQYANGGFTRSWSYFATVLYCAGAVVAVLTALLALWARRRNIRKDAQQDA